MMMCPQADAPLPDHPSYPSPVRRLHSLLEDTLIEEGVGGSLVAVTRWGDIRLERPGAAVRELLHRMTLGPVDADNVVGREDGAERAELRRLLDTLGGCVVHSLGVDSEAGPVLSAEPLARQAVFSSAPPPAKGDRPVRLSRFATIRSAEGRLVVESPLSLHLVVLHRAPALRVLGELGSATTVADIAAALADLPAELVAEVAAYLAGAGMVVSAERDPRSGRPCAREDLDPRLAAWTHHDLLFHTRSRFGRNGAALGTRRSGTREAPTRRTGPTVPLPRGPLTARDRSAHAPSRRPVSVSELGELLSRALGGPAPPAVPGAPGPLAGMRLYVTVAHSPEVPRGVYRYDPEDHALVPLRAAESDVQELLDGARVAAGAPGRASMLITITAQISELARTLDGSGYSTVLLVTGALQERLRQAAASLGLAASTPVTGDVEVAARALGIDGLGEVSVGEFGAGG
ncbi:SagB family peptide dehydrogenase [Nocardiopsis rhodophaea]